MFDNVKSEPLIDLCEQYDLDQMIREATNHTIHGSTLIDVLLTNNPSPCVKTGNLDTGLSDSHNFVYAVMNIKAPRLPARCVIYRNYKNYDENDYAKNINRIPTTLCGIFDDPSDNYWALQTLVREIMDDHAPLKKAKVRARDTPFMNKELRKATRNKARLHKKFKRCPNNRNWERYRKQRNLTAGIRKSAIRDYFKSKCDGGQKNPDFWRTVKPFLTNKGSSNGNSIMIRHDDSVETKPQEVAKLMNDFYVNIASKIGGDIDLKQSDETNSTFVSKCEDFFRDHSSVKNIISEHKKCDFSFVSTNPETVEKIILNMDAKKSTGYDSIPPRLLKPVAKHISVHVSAIFNTCIDSQTFPENAKLAEVVPLFKKDDSLIIKNYRPVSILPSLSKIVERIIHNQLETFMDCTLDPHMAAYRKGYSCEHVLLNLVEQWKSALDMKLHAGAIFMDLSKAFDSLPHPLIIAKLSAYGLSRDSCALLWSYLSQRKQRVKLSGHVSDWKYLIKGVPQGSILGPVLFNVFMNDLFSTIKTASLHNYADDNSISATARSKSEVIQILTKESSLAMTWFAENMMEANASKFQALFLNCENPVIFKINNEEIVSESNVKLLGVHLDAKLNFRHHVSILCRKASAQLRVLQRLSQHLDTSSKMQIFRSFVLSHFMYCCLVWHFCGAQYTKKIERIQYRALKFVYGDFSSTYEDLLKKAGLPTLELSRLRSILNLVYKCVNKLSPPFLWDLYRERTVTYNLRNRNKVQRVHCRTIKNGLQSISQLGSKLWNELNDSIKNIPDLKVFQKTISNWIPSECNCVSCRN